MSESAYDRMKAERAQQEKAWTEGFDRAIRKEYAVLKVSARKYRIIKRVSYANVGWGTTDIVSWAFAGEPLSSDEVGAELFKLQNEKSE